MEGILQAKLKVRVSPTPVGMTVGLFACEAGQLSGQEGRTRAGLLRVESWFFSPGVAQPLESGLGFLYLSF